MELLGVAITFVATLSMAFLGLWQAQSNSQAFPARATRWLLYKTWSIWIWELSLVKLDRPFIRLCTYIVAGDHPLVQCLYLSMMCVGSVGFIYKGYPLMAQNPRVAEWHRWTALALTISCLGLFVRLCLSNPGVITSEEDAAHCRSVFPYDECLFPSGRICQTCKFEKPARSKHCSACGVCVAKYDHHCVWVRNCVGLFNWKLFMTFLVVHSALCVYGMYLIPQIIMGRMDDDRIWGAKVYVRGSSTDVTPTVALEYAVGRYTFLCGLTVALGGFALVLGMFTVFHLWIHLISDRTTNEVTRRPLSQGKPLPNGPGFFGRIQQDFFPHRWFRKALEEQHDPSPSQIQVSTEEEDSDFEEVTVSRAKRRVTSKKKVTQKTPAKTATAKRKPTSAQVDRRVTRSESRRTATKPMDDEERRSSTVSRRSRAVKM